jgi:hypothetical protein
MCVVAIQKYAVLMLFWKFKDTRVMKRRTYGDDA